MRTFSLFFVLLPLGLLIGGVNITTIDRNVGKGDAVVDTRAMIQALQHIRVQKGGVLYLPPGLTLLMNKRLSLPDNIRITSDGKGATLKLPAGYSDYCIFEIVDGHQIRIEHLNLDGDAVSRHLSMIRIFGKRETKNIVIRDCRIHKKNIQPNDNLIYLSGSDSSWQCSDIRIENNEFFQAEYGVRCDKNIQGLVINGNEFHHIKKSSIDIQGDRRHYCRQVLIEKNYFHDLGGSKPKDTGHPIRFSTAGTSQHLDAKVLNNTILGNHKDYKDGGNADMIAFYDCTRGFVRGNYVVGGGDVGIALWRTSYSIASDNIVGENNSVGIALDNAHDCLVANNMVFNNNIYAAYPRKPKRGGIYLWRGSHDNYIVGNRSFDIHPDGQKVQQYGILIQPGNPRNRIGSNDLRNNQKGEIFIGDATTIKEGQTSGRYPQR